MSTRLEDYDFVYPEAQVALTPSAKRDHSKLWLMNRSTGSLRSDLFYHLPLHLQAGDCLVLNNVRVLPVQLQAHRAGGGVSEVVITAEDGKSLSADSAWIGDSGRRYEALISRARKFQSGTRLQIGADFEATVLAPRDGGRWLIEVKPTKPMTSPVDFFSACGNMPLPPYIQRKSPREKALDRERYQTIFAASGGAVAAPTAGLHFTESVLQELKLRGVDVHYLTLNVSFGTFRPIRESDITRHELDVESYHLSDATADAVNRAKAEGRRVIAVGTTVTRTLETAGAETGNVVAGDGVCRLFIYPGYQFRIIDALLTNFHLPQSSLLILVSAFAGRERVLAAYKKAIDEGARLFSYGDAMLIA